MIGNAIFRREALVHGRRPRTYVFQALFLAGLVLVLVPLWPAGMSDGTSIAARGREIFLFGTFFEMILISLVAPTLTASAITSEKDKHTLELLVLTDAGPFAIVLGKLLARVASLAFLLFLSLPVIFALLTLGGIDVRLIGCAYAILIATALFGASVGIFLSTVLRKTTMAILGGYVALGVYLGGPAMLSSFGFFANSAGGAGTFDPRTAWASPWFDLTYLFSPGQFVPLESFPSKWWVNPSLSIGASCVLILASGLLLPASQRIDRAMGMRPLLEAMDRFMAGFAGLFGGRGKAAAAKVLAERAGPTGNPIYWKETQVNTLGRLRHWWRINFLVALLMVGSWGLFSSQLGKIEFHKVVGGALSGLIVLTATMIAATSVAKEREDRTLFVLATTPVDCPTYVLGKVKGILRNISFLMILPFLHVGLFILSGTIAVPSIMFVLLAVPVAAISAIVQGTFISLLFPTTLRAVVMAIGLLVIESLLPVCTCLHTFNPVLLLYYGIESPSGSGTATSLTSGNLGSILFLSCVFSVLAHMGLTSVFYSLMRSGFDRYIGRA